MPTVSLLDPTELQAPSRSRPLGNARPFTTLPEAVRDRRTQSAERRLMRLQAVPTERLGWPATWPFTCQLLGVTILNADMAYQRDLDMTHLRNIHNNFDPIRFGCLSVNLRPDGSYWLIDGQHRLQVARWREIVAVPCMVFQVEPREEPALITKLNRGQKKFGVHDRFRADLVADNERVWDLLHIVRRYGFSIDPNDRNEPNYIGALDALLRLHRARAVERQAARDNDYPEELASDKVERVLSLIKRVWGNEEKNARTHYMLLGLDMFHDIYGDLVEPELLDQALKELPIDKLYDKLVKQRADLMEAGKPLGMVTTVVYMIATRYAQPLPIDLLYQAYSVFTIRHGKHNHHLNR